MISIKYIQSINCLSNVPVLSYNRVFNKKKITVKPVYKKYSREPENVPFMSSCPLYTS